MLAVRFCNNSRSVLLNNEVRVIARITSSKEPQVIANVPMKILREGVELDSTVWAYSRSGVPFTVFVPLDGDVGPEDAGESSQICIPGWEGSVDKSTVSILTIITGTVKDNGSTYLSSVEHPASDILYGHFQEVYADYMRRPETWRGWDNFDGNAQLFVFGYGSLVSPESVAGTLGHAVDDTAFRDAHLAGWKRAWNVGSDKESHPERTFYLNGSGSNGERDEFTGVTVVLGLERAGPRDGCNGTIFPVERHDISLLDVRERNYERIDVTDRVTWAGKPDNCVVYTYAPRQASMDRITSARTAGRPINIRRAYVELVENAFSSIGRLKEYQRATPRIPFDIVDMDAVIDPNLAASVARSANASYLASPSPVLVPGKDTATAGETSLPDH